jgi:predicted acetyltransferase
MAGVADVRPITGEAEERAYCRIAMQTFSFPQTRWEKFVSNVGRENLRVVCREGEIVGGLACYRMGQWFGGRSIGMAGVAAVAIAPEYRSAGLAPQLMSALLRELHAAGVPLATLYASTQRLYRKVGFEQAGNLYRHRFCLSKIGWRHQPLPMRRIDTGSSAELCRLDRARAEVTNGCLDRSPGMWRRLLDDTHEDVFAYLVGEAGREAGYLVYTQKQHERERNHLLVRDLVVLSAAAAQTLWAFFSNHQTIVDTVSWNGPAVDPLLIVPLELATQVAWQRRWMTRITDVRGAFSSRGYPGDIEEELHLEVTDDLIAANNGRFRVRIHGGIAEVSDGGHGSLRAGIRGLAPLFSGLLTPRQLHRLGVIEADTACVLDTAARCLAGPEPWMPDKF